MEAEKACQLVHISEETKNRITNNKKEEIFDIELDIALKAWASCPAFKSFEILIYVSWKYQNSKLTYLIEIPKNPTHKNSQLH